MTPAERRVLLVLLLWLASCVGLDLWLLHAPRELVPWVGPAAVAELAQTLPETDLSFLERSDTPAPSRPRGPDAPPVYDSAGRLLLNRADSVSLVALEGVGPVLAGRLLARRRERGPYRSPADLGGVKGIGPATLARLLPQLSFAEPDTAARAAP